MNLSRPVTFGLLTGACMLAAGLYLAYAVQRDAASPSSAEDAQLLPTTPDALSTEERWLIFRRTSQDVQAGALAVAPIRDLTAARVIGDDTPERMPKFSCERVHMAGDKGVCLTAARGVVTTYSARVFDRTFALRAELPLAGVPSRTQVSPDGSLAAATVFVTGHSYADGGFSTRTSIINLESGTFLVDDLESFTVVRDGRAIQSPDFNFWGVTFLRDSRSFYATLGTKGETLLIKGDVDTRTVEVVDEHVECPSLSPDDRWIAFKRREGGGIGVTKWRLWVLNLATRERHPLSETRSVDDQVQWLDNDRVLYALPGEGRRAEVMDQWTALADGSGQPERVLAEAYSASPIRP